ncbi:MAG: leucine--tRNA ligase [Bdellovibrionales bacterium]|nr:leucine--tRNA ligase [Bdellovibrionales bacterium]
MSYNHNEIDKKWSDHWIKNNSFKAERTSDKPKFYALDMFPYPSGAGLHVGHLASYTPTDIVSRYKRAKGFNVLHPMGYDAFGLPAEQYAIQTGVHPEVTTQKAIENFRSQLQAFGYSFDWAREISTCDPKFYKWTQFIFKKLYEKGLAYQKEVPVNWCPALKTVLANEEVIDGKSERGGHSVIRMPMKQWMLKITAYAERLLNDLDKIDWPDRTKEGQRNWIGKSVGANVQFSVKDHNDVIEVFTTRPDTLFGVSFMVLAPEHPLVAKVTSEEQASAVKTYVEESLSKSEVDRKINTEKTGVFTGGYCIHPITGDQVPIWIADYVLMGYGTGAIMAVPAHDERDYEFAQKFDLKILPVFEAETLPHTEDGTIINSDFLNGMNKEQAIDKMISHLEEKKLGTKETQYKLRDWLFSRQRYWGEPFPVVHFPKAGLKLVPDDELPVLLPEVADYEPTDQGEPPLARVEDFVNYKDPETGEVGQRDTDTMPGSAGSSWYFLRYTDPTNESAPFDFESQKYWMPVDLYVGGPEHTVGHLLYSRFWQKVLFDAGLVTHDEPFQKLAHQGMILGPDNQKMSKSRGNVGNPDEGKEKFGADAVRMYISFMGPFDRDKPWSTQGVEGVRRFLDRVWRLCFDDGGKDITSQSQEIPEDLLKTYHKTIKKVTEDIEAMSFNTAVSAMMILVNELYKHNLRPKFVLKTLSQLLMPFAPHLAEEIWSKLGGEGLVSLSTWPEFIEELTVDDVITMGVQVTGKMRGTIEVTESTSEEEALDMAKKLTAVSNAIDGKNIVKVIYKPGKILNIIAK